MAAVTVTNLTPGTKPRSGMGQKRGLRGAMAAGTYRGPIIGAGSVIEGPASPTHASGAAAGGVEDSTGYRESDTYDTSAVATSNVRPTGRTAYTGAGVQGGSTPGDPFDATGRAYNTKDRFGRTKAADVPAGLGGLKFTNFDARASLDGDDGAAAGVSFKTTVDGETVTEGMATPTIGAAADPAAGTVGLVDKAAGGIIRVDLHADDITGGANTRKGVEVAVFERGDDTDEDARLVGYFSADGGTDITDAITTGAGTFALYARFRFPGRDPRSTAGGAAKDPNLVRVGPWSARSTLAVT